uniref:ANK_REP_REGION domain-containing protein n=1 Tax=Parascaris equorum TaxID=6256 RepID=A0A914RLC5_PAREQ
MSTIGAFLDTFMLTVNEGIINANLDMGVRPPPFSRSNVLHVFDATITEMQSCGMRIKLSHRMCQDVVCEFPKEVGLVYQVSRLRPIENKGPEEDLMEEDGLFATTLLETVCRLVKVCDQLSMYPLHAACRDTDKPVVEITDCFSGKTALHTLLQCDKPRLSIVKLLLERGAKLLARNANDETCLEIINRKMPQSLAQLKLGRYITLAGLAANALQRHRIPHDFLSIVPKDLLPTLRLY